MKDTRIDPREEFLNTISHIIGAIFGIVGLFLLLSKNSHKTDDATSSIVVYSATFISMFLVSAIYHAVTTIKTKRVLRIVDHINIYFLIAGTYTPICLITLIHGKGWEIFYIVWGITAVGSILKLLFTGRFEIVSLVLYLAMGWLVVYDFDNLLDYTPEKGIQLLLLGGAFYTLGIVFYAIDRIPYNHFIWHLFVLAGAVSHWLMIYFYVI